jgi:hypothetical protein
MKYRYVISSEQENEFYVDHLYHLNSSYGISESIHQMFSYVVQSYDLPQV